MAKYIISILAFVLYAGICEWIYLCKITKLWCPGQKTEIVAQPVTTDPIIFDWSKEQPDTTSFFAAYKQQLLSSNLKDSILEITGYFTLEELGGDEKKELGMERAKLIRNLFPEIPDSLIKISQLRVTEYPTDPGHPFRAAKLVWIPKISEADATGKPDDYEIDQVLKDRAVINFPYKSSDRIKSDVLETYLKDLARQLISSGDQVTLTGFTDNIGGEAYNIELSSKRAKEIEALLIEYGVPKIQIKTVAKGSAITVESNDTEAGRAKNRRVEVERSKKTLQ
jgi:outer membrane protein OmpA-like peptidoglycan-associated protein